MSLSSPEGFPDKEVPFEHIAIVEGGYFDDSQPPEVNVGDVIVTRFGDTAVEVFEINEEAGILAGYDSDDGSIRFRVPLSDVLDMTRYHNAVLELKGRSDKTIAVSDDGRQVSMFNRGSMN